MFIVTSKKEIEENCFGLINEWIKKSDISAKIVYRSWIDKDNGYIKYDGQPLNVKCDFCIFLNIDNVVYHLFINFKVNINNIYQIDARKKALLIQRKNGLVSYDNDSKLAFRVTNKDKKAIFLFVVPNVSNDNVNSWKSRVLCCHLDNVIPTIKHAISDIKANTKLVLPKKKIRSILDEL